MRPVNRRQRLGSHLFGPPIDRQVDEEIDLHIELLARELMAEGMEESKARSAAAERFHPRAEVAAACSRIARGAMRRLRLAVLLDEIRQDVLYGLRQLARAPGFTVVALLTLAVGLGAAIAIFSVVEGVVLRRFPFAHPERLMVVMEQWRGVDSAVSAGNFLDLRAASRGFSALAALRLTSLNLAGGDQAERVLAARATSSLFAVFGVRPLLGRPFDALEDQPGNDRVVVLSHGLWTRRFAADPSILGSSLHLSGEVYRVIGVMPPGFDPTLAHEDLWLPIAFTPAQRAEHDDHNLTVVGRLLPRVARTAAQTELTLAMRHIAERFPQANLGRGGIKLEALSDSLIGGYRQRLLVLLAAVGLVLLIACANIANLLLGRGATRGKELAIRAAIGAGSRRIARQLLTESALLGLGAGIVGTGLAAAGVRLLVRLAPPGIPRIGESRVDAGALLFALAAALGSALLFGTAPALRAGRKDPHSLLRERAAGSGPASYQVPRLAVAGEVALALTLLVGAGLLIRSSIYLQQIPAGFETADLLTAKLSLPEAVYRQPAAVQRAFGEVVERLAHTPGVRAAAAVSAPPLGPGGGTNGLLPEGRPMAPENLIEANLHIVTADYFRTLRVPLLAGRFFAAGDVRGAQRAIIVSRELARRAWGDADPIGKRIVCCEGSPQDPRLKTVVGMVGDLRSRGPAAALDAEFYLPIAAWVILVLLATSLLAILIPVLRATKIDPSRAVQAP